MSTTEPTIRGAFMKLAGSLVLVALGTVWSGFIAMKLWNWFVVLATGWGEVSLALAIGLSVTLTFPFVGLWLRLMNPKDTKTDTRGMIERTLEMWFAYGVIFLFAWLVTFFI